MTAEFQGVPVSWSLLCNPERWDSASPYLEVSPDCRLWEWDGEEWVTAGDGVVGPAARWADDGGAVL